MPARCRHRSGPRACRMTCLVPGSPGTGPAVCGQARPSHGRARICDLLAAGHRILGAKHALARLLLAVEVVDGKHAPALAGHADPEEADLTGGHLERHETAGPGVDAVMAQQDAVLARLDHGVDEAVL